jgi:hypothetical protein
MVYEINILHNGIDILFTVKVQMGNTCTMSLQTRARHMPPSGKLSVGVWKIRFREKLNMMKIDDPMQ